MPFVRATEDVFINAATSKLTLRWAAPTTNPSNLHTWRLLESINEKVTGLPPAANITTPDPKITVERSQNEKFINAVYRV